MNYNINQPTNKVTYRSSQSELNNREKLHEDLMHYQVVVVVVSVDVETELKNSLELQHTVYFFMLMYKCGLVRTVLAVSVAPKKQI